MKTLDVTGTNKGFSYSIIWEDSFDRLAEVVKTQGLFAPKYCIITDSNVEKLYLDIVRQKLIEGGYKVYTYTIPAGETSKNLDTISNIYEYLLSNSFERKDMLIALGGGVVGDITGYAAASYLRGIDFIQIPTTLLAQVDSSIGGKTGVDFRQYKNMIGAFHQPRLVYMNTHVLDTLDEAQFASGMGEVLKSGLIADAAFYEWTINHMAEIEDRVYPVLSKMVRSCCKIKKDVVEKDPTEQGIRAILNFGHTVGHAVEKLKDFTLLHGQCVALGTVAAAYISFMRDMLSAEEFYEIRDMNVGFSLPIMVDGLTSDAVLAATKSDKKMADGKIKFILLSGIGHAVIDHTVTDQELLEAIDFINGDVVDEDKN